jgi:hypothetical protein
MRHAAVKLKFGSLKNYKRLCPHCGHRFQTVFNQTTLRLGPGSRVCERCDKSFPDGSKEWPDLTEAQKKQFLYGDLPAVGIIGAALAVVFIYAALKIGDIKIGFVLLGLLIALGVVILGIFYLICWLNIRRSEKRRWGRGF